MKLRLFSIGRTNICISVAAFAAMLLAVLMNRAGDMAISIVVLTLHECAHTLAAMVTGRHVDEIELTPVGLCATLSGSRPNVADELFIASTGPIFSLFAGLGCFYVYKSGLLDSQTVYTFASVNMAVAVVNLIPAVPLDGGRMLESLLRKRLNGRQVTIICTLIGALCGTAVIAVGIYIAVIAKQPPVAAVFGMFMAVSAIKRSREQDIYPTRRLAFSRERACSGLGTSVYTVALDRNVTAKQALRTIRGSGITVFIVLDGQMRTLGSINEAELYEAMAVLGTEATLGRIIKEMRRVIDRSG